MNSTVTVQLLMYIVAATLLTLMTLHNATTFDVVRAIRSLF